jgi:hypothetical protein
MDVRGGGAVCCARRRADHCLVDYRDEFDLGLTQAPRLGIATLGEFADVWRTLQGGFAVMPPRTWVRLSALGLPMREIARIQDRVIVSRR